MRILLYGINYAPELTGIGKYTGEMCAYLAKQGHTVHVITAMPYYPRWKKDEKYRWKLWHKEVLGGVSVYRCPLYVPKNITPVRRILHEFSFVLSSVPIWIERFFSRRYDTVISVSPPFHLGFLALVYSFLRRTPVIIHMQDLQIDLARDMHMIKSRKLLDLMFAVERFVLNQCNTITTISTGMLRKIVQKGVPYSKCELLPNWVDEEMIHPLTRKESLRTLFGLNQTDQVVLYSGNLGEKQGLENILEAAKSFRHRRDVHFIVVGAGGAKQSLQEAVHRYDLHNVRFFPLQAYDDLSALLAIADVHLVMQKKSTEDLMMPSKLTSILAAGGVPLVTASKGSTIYNEITRHHMGIVVQPDNILSLTEGIKKALNTDLQVLSINARNYAEMFLSHKTIMNAWEKRLHDILYHYKLYVLVKNRGMVVRMKNETAAFWQSYAIGSQFVIAKKKLERHPTEEWSLSSPS